jgi:hypothetical protein
MLLKKENLILTMSGSYHVNLSFSGPVVLEKKIEASAGGLLVPEGLYSPVAKYFSTCFKI